MSYQNGSQTAQTQLDSSSEEDEEKATLIPKEHSLSEDERRKLTIVKGVNKIYNFWLIFVWSVILAGFFFLGYIYASQAFFIYFIFGILWIAHIALYAHAYRLFKSISGSLMLKSNITTEEYDYLIEENESLNPLVIFIARTVLWTVTNASFLLIAEIFLFLWLCGVWPIAVALIPIYVMMVIFIADHFIFRQNNWKELGTIICTFLSLLMVTIKISPNTSIAVNESLSWFRVFLPLYFALHYWVFIVLHVQIWAALSFYRLKTSQWVASWLYLASFVGLATGATYFIIYLDNETKQSEKNIESNTSIKLKTAAVVTFISMILLFIAISIDLKTYIRTTINRLGGSRPKILKRNDYSDVPNKPNLNDEIRVGGWIVDSEKSYRNFSILGEIECGVVDYQPVSSLRNTAYNTINDHNAPYRANTYDYTNNEVSADVKEYANIIRKNSSGNRSPRDINDNSSGGSSGSKKRSPRNSASPRNSTEKSPTSPRNSNTAITTSNNKPFQQNITNTDTANIDTSNATGNTAANTTVNANISTNSDDNNNNNSDNDSDNNDVDDITQTNTETNRNSGDYHIAPGFIGPKRPRRIRLSHTNNNQNNDHNNSFQFTRGRSNSNISSDHSEHSSLSRHNSGLSFSSNSTLFSPRGSLTYSVRSSLNHNFNKQFDRNFKNDDNGYYSSEDDEDEEEVVFVTK